MSSSPPPADGGRTRRNSPFRARPPTPPPPPPPSVQRRADAHPTYVGTDGTRPGTSLGGSAVLPEGYLPGPPPPKEEEGQELIPAVSRLESDTETEIRDERRPPGPAPRSPKRNGHSATLMPPSRPISEARQGRASSALAWETDRLGRPGAVGVKDEKGKVSAPRCEPETHAMSCRRPAVTRADGRTDGRTGRPGQPTGRSTDRPNRQPTPPGITLKARERKLLSREGECRLRDPRWQCFPMAVDCVTLV